LTIPHQILKASKERYQKENTIFSKNNKKDLSIKEFFVSLHKIFDYERIF